MPTTVRELAEACDAQLFGGNPDTIIHAAANTDDARPGEITFIANARHLAKLTDTAACAVIVAKGSATDKARPTTALLLVDDPELAFMTCLLRLYPAKPGTGTISTRADVDPSAQIGPGTSVGPFASIGARSRIGEHCRIAAGCRIGDDVRIGDHCVLHPDVVLYDGIELGDHVIIHAGTVIGADGFGYKFRDGKHVKFSQVGTVTVGSHVEIGANTCIDRASLGATRIGSGTKIDNQVHIAHNVQVGEHVLMCGQVGIGGSTVIDDYAVLASQCGVSDHVRVGQQSMVFAQAGVTKDVDPKDQVMGYPATNRREALHQMAAMRKLASQQKTLDELVKQWPQLKTMLAGSGNR